MKFASDYQASDGAHFAEIDGDILTICRASDGRALIFQGRKFAQAFQSDCERHGAERAIRAYIRTAPYTAADNGAWQESPYKPGKVPELIRAYSETVRNYAATMAAAAAAFDAEFLQGGRA